MESPSKGDWSETVQSDFKYLEISLSLEDIRNSPENQFNSFVKEVTTKKALEYLNNIKMNTHQSTAYTAQQGGNTRIYLARPGNSEKCFCQRESKTE